MKPKLFALINLLTMVGLAAGCAGPPPNLFLQGAETAYKQAQRDPDARKYAPQALADARRYLERAQVGWQRGFNKSNVYFYADLSRRYSETALLQGAHEAAKTGPGVLDARWNFAEAFPQTAHH